MGCDRRWVVGSAAECPVKMVFGQPGQNDDLQDQNPPEQLALARRSRCRVVGVVCHGDFTWSRRRAKSAKNRKTATNAKKNGKFATNRVGLCAMGKKPPCDKTHGDGATFCPVRHQAVPNRMRAAERVGSVLRDLVIEQEGGGRGGEGVTDEVGEVAVEVDGAGVDGVGGCPRRGSGADHRGRCRGKSPCGIQGRRGRSCGRSRSRRVQTGHQAAPWERAIVHGHQDIEGSSGFEEPRLSPPAMHICAIVQKRKHAEVPDGAEAGPF